MLFGLRYSATYLAKIGSQEKIIFILELSDMKLVYLVLRGERNVWFSFRIVIIISKWVNSSV